jgi:HK97 family phage prohead protease
MLIDMPYELKTNATGCDGIAVVKVGENTPVAGGCHQSEADAKAHMKALNLATLNETTGVRFSSPTSANATITNLHVQVRAVDLTPTSYMIANCKKGLRYHQEGKSGDGLQPKTVREAKEIASGQALTPDKVKRMRAWIARHLVDLDNAPDAGDAEYPSAGQVAHLLWASGTTREQAQKTFDWCEKKMKQIEAEQNNAVGIDTEERELPPSYRPADAEDVPVVRPSCGNCEYFCIKPDLTQMILVNSCKRWEAPVDPNHYCDAWEAKEEEDDEEEMVSEEETIIEEDSNAQVAWVVRNVDDKRSLAFTNLECRAIGEGNTLVGYAAMFDMPSHDLGGFTEYVSRGAFTKTLKDGADVRLLIDHDGAPLARTKSNTMRLMEDERGLRVEAELDPANPRAAEIISALKRGDMNQMSFAFRVIRDEWSKDRSTRTLKEVRLFDVSVVTFPAYEDTVAEIRNAQIVDNTTQDVGKINLRKRQIQLLNIQK